MVLGRALRRLRLAHPREVGLGRVAVGPDTDEPGENHLRLVAAARCVLDFLGLLLAAPPDLPLDLARVADESLFVLVELVRDRALLRHDGLSCVHPLLAVGLGWHWLRLCGKAAEVHVLGRVAAQCLHRFLFT